MVLILSSNNDLSTGEVIRWLLFYKIDYLRLNEDENIQLILFDENNLVFKAKERTYSLNDFNSVWYRRGRLNIDSEEKNDYLKQENRELISAIYRRFIKKKHINTYFNSHLNKLFALDYKGFQHVKIPSFLVTQSKSKLSKFMNECDGQIISKPMFVPFSQASKNDFYMAYTSIIEASHIKKLNNEFVPTFFQEYVQKKYEIRVFYLNKTFYSMCIFSQKNKKTTVDFRNYDRDKPNRISPFKLPNHIEEDLRQMLSNYKMDCASLDIIFNGRAFYLLDVNPVGQFGMVSNPCNYHLEEKIAKFLITDT